MGQIKIDASNIADSLLQGFVVPKINSIVYPTGTATDPAGGETITVKGTGFQYGATVRIAGVAVGVTTVVDFNTITFTAPAKTAGNYALTVLNADSGLGTSASDLVYSGVPTWSTAAGSLGSAYESQILNTNLSANSDSAISYSLESGTLPAGATLASNGLLSGTLSNVNNATTYNFTIAATDAESQANTRSFSYVINPDVVSFSTSNNITISTMATTAMSTNTMVATSAAGKTITYSVNSLPTGVSINATSGAITGTPTTTGNSVTLVTATADGTNKYASISVNFNVSAYVPPELTILLVAGGGGGGYGRTGNHNGGGGGAGGVLSTNVVYNLSTTYTISIGGGGGAYTSGSSTTFSGDSINLTAIGGGNGGGSSLSPTVGGNGGSGGGAAGSGPSGYTRSGGTALQPTSTDGGLGYAGGSGQGTGFGGGGGGSAAVGVNGVASTSTSGAGGNGTGAYSSILAATGSGVNISGTYYIAAGGGGAGSSTGGNGGALGGNSASGAVYGGQINTGTGGGAGVAGGVLTGGSGGSGLAIITYSGNPLFTGGSVTTTGGNTYHKFTSSGSLVPL